MIRFVEMNALSLHWLLCQHVKFCLKCWGARWLLLLMEACFIRWGRATDTRVIKSATLGAHMRAKPSTSQIYTNGPLLFTGYNTAAQFTAALWTDAEAQMHRGESEHTHTPTHTTALFFLFSPSFFITDTRAQPGQILSNLCWSNLRVIVEIARVEEVNQWLCREAVFPIKEKADACIGLRLLTDSCKDEQWLSRFITWERETFSGACDHHICSNCHQIMFFIGLRGEYNPELFIRTVNGWCFIEEARETDGFATSEKRVAGAHMHINTT